MSSNREQTNSQEEIPQDVGKIGEEIVMDFLQKHYHREYPDAFIYTRNDGFEFKYYGNSIVEATWLNYNSPPATGMDISLRINHKVRYIEVKATDKTFLEDRKGFKLTTSQIHTMCKYWNNFDIYRVYETLSSKPQILILRNPGYHLIDLTRKLPTNLYIKNSDILAMLGTSSSFTIA